MIGIEHIESIGHQASFKVENVWSALEPLQTESLFIAPEYKNYIPTGSLRRFSHILRFSMTAALAIQEAIGQKPFDAISIGTGLGCLVDTEKFLQQVVNSKGETLSPTSFIQSTHNTIGGAISMALKNHSYNMTHTQKYLSFEWALLDAMMKMNEGAQNVLVGGSDENIPFLAKLQPDLIKTDFPLTSGTTFLNLVPESDVYLKDLTISYGDKNQALNAFLENNNLTQKDIDLVLYANNGLPGIESIQFLSYTGNHQCNVGFAFHLAVDAIRFQGNKTILIINDQQKVGTSFSLVVGKE